MLKYLFKLLTSSILDKLTALQEDKKDISKELLDIFYELNPDIFIIKNKDNKNQIWRLYTKSSQKVLACIQDTYQIFKENNTIKKIGWITAWIESPNITDSFREEASKEISDSMYNQFEYIWGNKEWIGNSTEWELDGQFHWYVYQWDTNISIKKSYCILN
jgi:hypothetical protein